MKFGVIHCGSKNDNIKSILGVNVFGLWKHNSGLWKMHGSDNVMSKEGRSIHY